ncbi:ABC transporter substrate-binding protein [Pelagibacterium limicola]|uniref:ABC transporter substrate-binding protein n=1 Tax=Pelagibacterium limicola TaxID=2791022 RepID=UPI0018AFB3DA|nr:ABC transporter substrate-binding protein [Pelagibacterium limicola]
MHKTLLAGASALVLSLALAAPASAQAVELPDLSGQSLTVFGPWVGGAEIAAISAVIAEFNEQTGANAEYVGSDSLEQQIVIDAQAGSAPEVTFFPQPGLAANMASQGFLTPLPEGSDQWILDNYAAGQSWVDLGTYADANGEDQLYGFFYNVNLKSLVWYVPDNFEDAGYEVPETMEDLIALSEQIVEDGGTPWCIGLGSEAATGWPATDWVEDLMLRLHAPEVYDQWVSNEIPFNDPRVVEAIEAFGMFAKNDAWVAGGAQAVGTTDFRDSPAGLFQVPPQCYMHRQASFIPAFFPDGTELGVDADFFYFPSYAEKDLGNPVMGGGTLAAITNDSPAAQAFMDYLKLPVAHEIWMSRSGFLTPHQGADLAAYADDTLRAQGEIMLNATTFRFDGSDLMPGAIGAGAFWTGMVDFVGGASAEDVANNIETAWSNL